MKYARKVDEGYVDYIEIPQPWPENYWTNDPVEFCERMFPGTTGWEQVPDDAGRVDVAPPLAPQVSKEELLVKIQALLDAVNALD